MESNPIEQNQIIQETPIEDVDKNKLQESQEAKQGASYYYAHKYTQNENEAVKKHFDGG